MILTIPPYPRRLSLITLLYGIILFFWLSPEDSIWLVSVLGWGMSILAVTHTLYRFSGRTIPRRFLFPAAVALGGMIGGGAVISTILLMFMKTALHNHIYPDYGFPLMAGTAERLPAWVLAGALLGLAAAFGYSWRRSKQTLS